MPLLSLLLLVFVGFIGDPALHPLMQEAEVTSAFGMQRHPVSGEVQLHRGVDFQCEVGTPVYATDAGRIRISGSNRGYGTYILIEHPDGFDTLYAQLSEALVEAGAYVQAGQQIARSGDSGEATAPHLHYEIWKDGEAVDPMHYLPAF